MLSTVEVAGKRAGDATFLAQPKGLFYLAFTEGVGTVLVLWNADRVHVNDGPGRRPNKMSAANGKPNA
jgi:hypothetical protein